MNQNQFKKEDPTIPGKSLFEKKSIEHVNWDSAQCERVFDELLNLSGLHFDLATEKLYLIHPRGYSKIYEDES